jgi:hypothetical protein
LLRVSYTCSGCGRVRRAKPYDWAANHLYCKLCISRTEEAKVADLIPAHNNKETMTDRFFMYARREASHKHVSLIEKLNTPFAVVLVLVFFIALDGLLFYLYQQKLP